MMKKLTPKQKKILIILPAILVVLCLVLLFFLLKKSEFFSDTPTLTIETPQKVSSTDHNAFTVDVTLSDMGEALYPAASVSVVFDSSKLEFLGVEEGDIMISDDEKADGTALQLPNWSVDAERSNEVGQINVMYLDMTGGKYAFSKELISDGETVLMRLSFRLRGSAKAGDIYELAVTDAVLAASDESQSLAVTAETLKTKNGRIVVGE